MIEVTPEYLEMGRTEWEARIRDIDGLVRATLSWNQLIEAFVKRADASGYTDIELDGAVTTYIESIGMKYDLPYVFELRRLESDPKGPIERPNTVKEWIAALRKLDPNLPLFVRCKYTGRTDWTMDCPIFTKGLSEMEPGEGILYPHATIRY